MRSFSDELLDLSICHLPFEVRYQLEVCISEGWLSEYSLSYEFVKQLTQLERERAKEILEDVASHKQHVEDPMGVLTRAVVKPPSRRKIPHYCTYIRSANVTPTTIYFTTPTLEISNRVIRHFAEHADRFLRVRFTDEKYKVSPVKCICGYNMLTLAGENLFYLQANDERALHQGQTHYDEWYHSWRPSLQIPCIW